MGSRVGTVFELAGILFTGLFFVFFAKLAFDGELTWNPLPTAIFVLAGFVPYLIGRALRFIFSGT